MDLFADIQQLIKELDIAIKMLRKTGADYAEAEKDYKMELRKQALNLRDDGEKVTMINMIIYGVKSVAEKRLQRDIKEAIYKANQESIQVTKTKIRVLENQLQREWSN